MVVAGKEAFGVVAFANELTALTEPQNGTKAAKSNILDHSRKSLED